MKLIERRDGMIMNISAGLFFTPNKNGLIVEMPDGKVYLVDGLYKWNLIDEEPVHYCEFEIWRNT